MSEANAAAPGAQPGAQDRILFWGCFIALITTAFGFITRLFLLGEWAGEFGLDEAQTGELAGIGIWPFAVSIILFSLFIDKIGYKTAMVFSFLGYVIWSVMGVSAYFISDGGKGDPDTGYQLLYWGSLILGLSNGTVEAYINPVVATMFSKEKTKWLNILHAGWPGGLVIAGLITVFLNSDMVTGGDGGIPWWIKIAIIAPPAIVFFIMLVPLKFPAQERVAAGVSYREMLAEFGVLGALIVGFLLTLQLIQFFPDVSPVVFIVLGVGIVIAFGVYTRSLGSPILFVLALIMMPLATTELGTDGWIEEILKGVAAGKFDPGLVLVYTSLIMMILRFFAGPIVHQLSPLGLLIASSVLAIVGLYTLSFTEGMVIFGAATLYAFGKTFFWPTMLGIVSEQTPKGGALTLNAMGGIGMLAVGVLGFPFIGTLQADKGIEAVRAQEEIVAAVPALVQDGKLTVTEERDIYYIIKYDAIDGGKLDKVLAENLPGDPAELAKIKAQREAEGNPVKADEIILTGKQAEVAATIKQERAESKQGALANMTIFPVIMLVGYICLFLYYKSKGGYKAQILTGHAAQDEEFTGGVEGPADQ